MGRPERRTTRIEPFVAWGATYLLVAEQEPTIWLVPVLVGVATLTTAVVIRRRHHGPATP